MHELKLENKKIGFTLIELLAVIVILAIIALISTPIILGMIDNAKKSSSQDSVYGYLETLEKRIAMTSIDSSKYPDVFKKNTTYDVNDTELASLNVKGTKPTYGTVKIGNNNEIESALLCINDFQLSYSNNKVTFVSSNCDSLKPAPSTSNLSALEFSNGSISFSKDTTNYAILVENSVSEIKITPTTETSNSTIKIGAETVQSESQSSAIPLSVGVNNISVVVTSSTNETKTYNIMVTRKADTLLAITSPITIRSGMYTAYTITKTGDFEYSTNTNLNTRISGIITTKTKDSNASIKINSNAITVGTTSATVSFPSGTTTDVIITVTNDMYITNYTLKVTCP